MKQIIGLALLLMLGSSLLAVQKPLSEGTYEVGGSASYHHYGGNRFSGYSGSGYSELKILPEFGYFVMDGLSIGGVTGYERNENGSFAYRELSIGIRTAFYFHPTSKGSPFFNASYRYGHGKDNLGDYGLKTSTRDLSVGFGYMFIIGNVIGLSTELDYVSDSIHYISDGYSYWDPPTDTKHTGYRWEILAGFKIFIH